MPDYAVKPFIGVGPVLLGMSRDDVRRAMPESAIQFRKSLNSRYETDAFHQHAVQVFYGGDQPRVEYIEVSRGSSVRAFYRDIEVFAASAKEVLDYILLDSRCDETNSEIPYGYIFPGLQLSVWRPSIPNSDNDAEGRCFSTIGIGVEGYFDMV